MNGLSLPSYAGQDKPSRAIYVPELWSVAPRWNVLSQSERRHLFWRTTYEHVASRRSMMAWS